MKFSGICLVTKDVPGLADFYAKVLDVETEGDDVHVELKTEGAGMTIFTVDGMEDLAPGSMRDAGTGNLTIGFEVADVDAEYDRVKAFGVEFVKHPVTHPWGTRSFWFRDPDRNIVNFFSDSTSK
jgi:catechol 2,3-dioxygenase-like lactoylglutathione lyase family enzyme